jgi:uncharacterized protein YndB with AHSA1/START domain
MKAAIQEMPETLIERTIEINASTDKVWKVFTDPEITRQMGGEYITDWKAGSSIGWRGLDGKMQTRGTILKIEPEKLIKHNLFNPGDGNAVTSVITYRFGGNGDHTTLFASEELNYSMTEQELAEAEEGWDMALLAVKDAAEAHHSGTGDLLPDSK